MSNHRNDFMDLHFAAVAGTLLGTRPQQAVAARDAEPETYEPRRGAVRRLVAAVRARRESAARPETTRI
jgi:hypothetical protein